MVCLHLSDISSKICQILVDPGHTLRFVGNLVKIQNRNFHAAADTHRIIIVFAFSGVLHIESAAGFIVCCPDLWYNNVIPAYF